MSPFGGSLLLFITCVYCLREKMCTKKDQTSAKILLLYFLCRQLSPADSPSHLGVVYL